MDTKVTTKEQISALADGELDSAEMTLALAALRESQDQRQAWAVYHQIGEVLRSDDMDVPLSAGFSARMSALLDAEPTIVAPQPAVQATAAAAAGDVVAANGDHRAARNVRPARLGRFALPGAAAAAAIVAAVFVAMPQQAVVTASAPVTTSAPTQVAVVSVPSAISTVSANGNANGVGDTSGGQNVTQLSTLAQQGEVKRDPRIDDYLFAHQRFSQSYNSAQYARSAAFSVPADK